MRNPVRSETDAFHIAVGIAVVLGVSLSLGALVTPLVGVALLGAVAGAFIGSSRRGTGPPAAAARGGRRRAERRRAGSPCVLVVANRTLRSDMLRAEVARRAKDGAEVHVVVPILCSRIHYIASDIDAELREARDRLDDTLAWARVQGLEITGKVGDPNIALGAIEDELRLQAPTRYHLDAPSRPSNWLETGIVERLRDDLDVPVTHTVVDAGAARATAAN